MLATSTGHAQTGRVATCWWTYQQDCNGNGCQAGNLPGDKARLNWSPVVGGCNGTITVFEIVYQETCGSGLWMPFYTNAPHSITGCRSLGDQYLDVQMGSSCACRTPRPTTSAPAPTSRHWRNTKRNFSPRIFV